MPAGKSVSHMKTEGTLRVERKIRIEREDAGSICDCLAAETGLSKSKIKTAMLKGAVQLKRPGRGKRRIRRATTPLHPGDLLELHYDAHKLAAVPPSARCLADRSQYSVWFKPAGLMTQGNDYGDHCALIRQVQQHFDPPRAAHAVHRLDREVAGILLVAHSRDAAARLSALFRNREIEKLYWATVHGVVDRATGGGCIDKFLDGKPAATDYTVLARDETHRTTRLEIRTATGRRHQIRRHLAWLGHPVMGDPAYGSGNKNAGGLQLCATRLAFTCPYRRDRVVFDLNQLLPDRGEDGCT